LNYIFPSVEGHAAIIDKYFSDLRASYYPTIKDIKLAFLIIQIQTLIGR
jgi:hypothetical protein